MCQKYIYFLYKQFKYLRYVDTIVKNTQLDNEKGKMVF
jgi:hypothetical protein